MLSPTETMSFWVALLLLAAWMLRELLTLRRNKRDRNRFR